MECMNQVWQTSQQPGMAGCEFRTLPLRSRATVYQTMLQGDRLAMGCGVASGGYHHRLPLDLVTGCQCVGMEPLY